MLLSAKAKRFSVSRMRNFYSERGRARELKQLLKYRLSVIKSPVTGLLTEEIFYNIFSKFFPLGGDTYNGEAGGRRQEAGGRGFCVLLW